MRWVHHYEKEFEQRWNRVARLCGLSSPVDGTYVTIRGWLSLYRAVDRGGKTVDFRLSPRRHLPAAEAFFRKAIRRQGSAPGTITLDGYAATYRAVREMRFDDQLAEDTKLRAWKYLSNLVDRITAGEAADRRDARPQPVQDRGDHHRRD
jgi:putative transposase